MLERPDIPDEKILAGIHDVYGLPISRVSFLPLGVDVNAAVFQAEAEDDRSYFLKLRRGVFDENAVTIPKFLSDQGIRQIIAPIPALAGQLSARLDDFRMILYPFIEGRDGYEVEFSEHQWRDFGKALRKIHTAVIPAGLASSIPRESYSPQGRMTVRMFLGQIKDKFYDDPVARGTAEFLKLRCDLILDLVEQAEKLAANLQANPPEFVLCHSDLHAGNLLVDSSGSLYIVDWDSPILAPKEHDLMFFGNAQGFRGYSPQEEETLFYKGYGKTEINQEALAYYRYERIIQDIAVFCEQIFSTNDGSEDREQGFTYLRSNFLPSGTIELAYRSDLSQGK